MTGAVEGRLAEQWVKVRVLHAPQVQNWLDQSGDVDRLVIQCDECMDNDYEPATWPCPTAKVVFSVLEVAAALAGTPPEDEATT